MLLREMCFGYYDTQCLFTVAALQIADYLEHGPKSIVDLAALAAVKSDKLLRVMRYLAFKQVFTALPNDCFDLNAHSRPLLSSHPQSMLHFIQLHAVYFYQGAAMLKDSMAVEDSSFELAFGTLAGQHFRQNPQAKLIYHQAMRESTEYYAQLIVDRYDFSPYRCVIDIGGGLGVLLAQIFLQHDHLVGVNFDVPDLQLTAEQYLDQHGMASRIQYQGGDFQQSVPTGGDLYIMKAILHSMPDDAALTVLRHCRAAIAPAGRLLLVERLMFEALDTDSDAATHDINMLNVTRGRVRSLANFEDLLQQSGWQLQQQQRLSASLSILECVSEGACT